MVLHTDAKALLAPRLNACFRPKTSHTVFASADALGLQLLIRLERAVSAQVLLVNQLNGFEQRGIGALALAGAAR